MKNYIYYTDEEEDFSEEELEPCQVLPSNMKPKVKPKEEETRDGFDVDIFDAKVARSISQIHRQMVNKDSYFSNWVNANLEHLENMYKLSNLPCSDTDFYSYIYENTSTK
tara:strand:- start:243 stop:572 length:330 start_codon:yes stop_codon:yes gene_type:complete